MPAKQPRVIHRIGRRRRAAGWMLLTLGVAAAAVWVASGWSAVHFKGGTLAVELIAGEVSVVSRNDGPASGGPPPAPFVPEPVWQIEPVQQLGLATPLWRFWFGWSTEYPPPSAAARGGLMWISHRRGLIELEDSSFGSATSSIFTVLLWPAPLLCWLAGVPLVWSGVRARRRARKGCCIGCGYSLAGLGEGAACPECGAAGPASDATTGAPGDRARSPER